MPVSMLISTYNRAVQLERSLRRLWHLTKPDELVIVDDDSHDHTREIAVNLADGLGVPLQYIHRRKPAGIGYDISSIPRNIGIKHCRYDQVLVVEPEVLFITDVVAQMLAKREAYPNHVISAGTIYFTNPATPVDDRIHQDPQGCLAGWDVKKMPMHPEDMFEADGVTRINFTPATVTRGDNLTATYCVLYDRRWLMEVGGWDEDMSLTRGGGGWGFEDTALLTRLRIKGYNQAISPDIQVIHQWHARPPGPIADGWKRNEEIFLSRRYSIDGREDPNNPNLVSNQGREWGVL